MAKKLNKKQEAMLHAKKGKMSPMQVAKRKRTTLSNAAGKMFGGY